jgi:hypothetical protein
VLAALERIGWRVTGGLSPGFPPGFPGYHRVFSSGTGRVFVRKFHNIEHPNKRQRVEFFCDGGGGCRYEVFDLVKKRWRRNPNGDGPFDSYAAALIDAHAAHSWISHAITPHTWHVELLRGHTFALVDYTEEYGDHDHCTVCWKKFTPPDSSLPEVEHRGYVTRYEIPNGSKAWQWNWVCGECYRELSGSLQWKTRDQTAP